ncbi:MAG: adenylate/guanylate cyclase domain-containing protein, partial [Anaerolineae bacterium]
DRIVSGQLDDLSAVRTRLHDQLHTPADAVLGYSELVIEEARDGGQSEMIPDLEKIHISAQKFIDLIAEIIDRRKNTHASKPAQPADAASGAFAPGTPRPSPRTAAVGHGQAPGSILIVDDSPINRDLLAHRLIRQGHTITVAENGHQALELVRRENFDLILLDVLMPEMNGYEVLQALKADGNWRDIPVIMISALDEMDSAVRCIEMGAEDYLSKPFNPVLLQARIGSSLEKKRLRDRQRELFGKFASREVVDELLQTGFSLGGKYVDATVLFADIRSFTTITEAQSPADTITLLNNYFGHVMQAIDSEGGIVNQMIGDGLLAIFGAPLPRPDHQASAVRAALKMLQRLELFNGEQVAAGKPSVRIGIGIASGQVIAGYTGSEMRATYTCIGDTVNIASRLESHTKILRMPILIDEATRNRLGPEFRARDEGSVQFKGKTLAVRIFSVQPGTAE